MRFTTDLKEALTGAELLVESITSKGIRPVFEQIKAISSPLLSDHYDIQRDRTK